jgi:dTDP-4-dehydrorhamnose 3,5-epimerase
MVAKETKLKGCFILEPKVFRDQRGYFIESFNKEIFKRLTGISSNFVQDNESNSSKGVLRGLHFQRGEYAQAKLVRVVRGSVMDVAVDIRPNSETFGQHVSALLSGKNKKQLYIPKGFAHGFVVLEDNTIFSYKCDNYYNKNAESGIVYNDLHLQIDWRLSAEDLILSDKDLKLPSFKDITLWLK